MKTNKKLHIRKETLKLLSGSKSAGVIRLAGLQSPELKHLEGGIWTWHCTQGCTGGCTAALKAAAVGTLDSIVESIGHAASAITSAVSSTATSGPFDSIVSEVGSGAASYDIGSALVCDLVKKG